MLLAYGFLRKVFEVFEKYRTSIDMITTSEVAVSVTIDSDIYLKEITRELEAYGTVEVDTNQTIVSIVGNEITETKDVMLKLFASINQIPVRMVSYSNSCTYGELWRQQAQYFFIDTKKLQRANFAGIE